MAVAGWYNDESDPTLARWHDGAGWTDHVVDKLAWEAYGQPPPPPSDEPERAVGAGRLRPVIGSLAVVAVLAVAGVALARDDDGGGRDRAPTSRTSGSLDRAGDRTGAFADGLTSDSVDPSADSVEGVEPGAGASSGGDRSSATSPGRTTPTTRKPGTVQRTETSTRTQTNTAPITAAPPGDKTSVGNTTNTTIKNGLPPTTAPPETTTTAPPEPTTSTSTGP